MTTSTLRSPAGSAGSTRKLGIIDADVHPRSSSAVPPVLDYLPERWQRYVREFGLQRAVTPGGDRLRHRQFASRWDAEVPGGGAPGSSESYAREQHLDRYEISAAILSDIGVLPMSGVRGQPDDLTAAYCRGMNEHRAEHWLANDPRWHASITVPFELPDLAVAEIVRCREETGDLRDRWKQILLAPDMLRSPGHRSYWPIYEACEHYGIAISYHVMANNRITPSGNANYYFEEHCDWAAFNFPLVSSFVFEGIFDRFPGLKVILVELGWSWVVPFSWRLDHAHRMLGSEAPHLTRKPSEYIRDHFWYTTQAIEEPEDPRWFNDVLSIFEESGMQDKLMYSSDYPHWDFDEPSSMPPSVAEESLRRILGENASSLYGLPLLPDQGMPI